MKYTLVTGTVTSAPGVNEIKEFVDTVNNRMMTGGWKPQGGVQVTYLPPDNLGRGGALLTQAMIYLEEWEEE